MQSRNLLWLCLIVAGLQVGVAVVVTCPQGQSGTSGSCANCPPGTYQDQADYAGECQQCPPNTYSEFSGSATCDSCDPYYTSPAGSDFPLMCTLGDCPANMHVGAGPDYETGTVAVTDQYSYNYIASNVMYNPTCEYYAYTDNYLYVVDVATNTKTQIHTQYVTSFAWRWDYYIYFVYRSGGSIKRYHVTTQSTETAKSGLSTSGSLWDSCMAISPDNSFMLVGYNYAIYRLTFNTGAWAWEVGAEGSWQSSTVDGTGSAAKININYGNCAMNADGSGLYFVEHYANKVRFYDIATNAVSTSAPGCSVCGTITNLYRPSGLTFTPDFSYMIIMDGSSTTLGTRLINMQTYEQRYPFITNMRSYSACRIDICNISPELIIVADDGSSSYIRTGSFPAGSDTCTDCPLDSFSPTGSVAITDCLCNAGYTGPDGGTCTQCAVGTYKNSPGSAACTDCDAGQTSVSPFTSSSHCQNCVENTYENDGVCAQCPDTRSVSPEGSTAVTDCGCAAGTWKEAEYWQAKDKTCSNNADHVAVQADPYTFVAKVICCWQDGWKRRTHPVTNVCFDEGGSEFTFFDAADICAEAGMRLCTLEELQDPNGSGQGCNQGCGANGQVVWVTDSCSANYISGSGYNGVNDIPTTCNYIGFAAECVNCVTHGSGVNDDHTACETCGWGKYSLSGECVSCAAGKYKNYGQCLRWQRLSCYANRYPDLIAAYSISNPNNLNSAEKTLLENHWINNGFDENRFMGCDAGTYEGCGNTCTDCPANKPTSPAGSTSADACYNCLPGKVYDNALSSCVNCEAGKYTQEALEFDVSGWCTTNSYADKDLNGHYVQDGYCYGTPRYSMTDAYGNKWYMFVNQDPDNLSNNLRLIIATGTNCVNDNNHAFITLQSNDIATHGLDLSKFNSDYANYWNLGGTAGGNARVWAMYCSTGWEWSQYATPMQLSNVVRTPMNDATSCVSCGVGKYSSSTGATSSLTCQNCVFPSFQNNVGASTCSTTTCATNDYLKITTNVLQVAVTWSINSFRALIGVYTLHTETCDDKPVYKHPTNANPVYLYYIAQYNQWAIGYTVCSTSRSIIFMATSDPVTKSYDGSSGNVAKMYLNSAWTQQAIDMEIYRFEETGGCEDCPAETPLSPAGSTSVDVCYNGCDPGQAFDSNLVCTQCEAGKYQPNSEYTGACIDCPSDSTSPAGSTSEGDCICNTGFENNGNLCQVCTEGEYKPTVGDYACYSCPSNMLSVPSKTHCECAAGYILDTASTPAVCVACPIATYKANNGNETTDCASLIDGCCFCGQDRTTLETGSVTAAQCVCQTGFGTDACTACAVGTYKATESTEACVNCPTGSTTLQEESVAATACVADLGYYGIAGGPFTQCAEGTYADTTGLTVCETCPTGSTSPIQSDAESDCLCTLDGYADGSHLSLFCTCAAGYYRNGLTCELCEIDTYCTGAREADTGCPSYSQSLQGSDELSDCKCNVGYSGPDGGSCTACASGSYKNTVGSEACSLCVANSNSLEASDDISDCTCNVGYSGPLGGPCSACAAGKYKDAIGSAECTACVEHETSPEASVSADACVCVAGYAFQTDNCVLCEAGKYKTTDADTACDGTCPADSTSPEGSDALADCVCNKGYSGPNGGDCVFCSAGKYKDSLGSALCTDCPANSQSISASDEIIDCKCNVGYTGADGEACAACPADTFKTSIGSAACDNCPANSQSPLASEFQTACQCNVGYNGPNGGTCDACIEGKYQDIIGQSSCKSCPSHTNSPSTSDELTDCICNVGYSGPDGSECIACVGGTYKDTTGSNNCTDCGAQETTENIASTQETDCICIEGYTFDGNNCIKCASGTYKTDIGDNTCDICPQHSNSPQGSILLTDCSCNAGYSGSNGQECIVCEPNTYESSDVCLNCPSYANSPVASDSITDCTCNAGYSGEDGADCIVCLAGTYELNDACVSCPPYSQSQEASSSITDCKCSQGYTGADGTACEACPANTYKDSVGSASCTACTAYSTSPSASAYVSQCTCINDYVDAGDGSCDRICAAGYEASGGIEGEAACVGCQTGTYKETVGDHNCTRCPPHSLSFLRNQTSIQSCFCEQGYLWNGAGCDQCAAGKFNDRANQTDCFDCITTGCDTYGGRRRLLTADSWIDLMSCGIVLNGLTSTITTGTIEGQYNASTQFWSLPAGYWITQTGLQLNIEDDFAIFARFKILGSVKITHSADMFIRMTNDAGAIYALYRLNTVPETARVYFKNDAGTVSRKDDFLLKDNIWYDIFIKWSRLGDKKIRLYRACEGCTTAEILTPTPIDLSSGQFTVQIGGAEAAAPGWDANIQISHLYVTTQNVEMPTSDDLTCAIVQTASVESDHTSCPGLCVAPAGYRVNAAGNNVEPCPINHYQDGDAANCTRCPWPSTYTSREGLTSIDECICRPGYTRQNGVCIACDFGFFKSEPGDAGCITCGDNANTAEEASDSITDCLCEANFEPEGENCIQCAEGKSKHFLKNDTCIQCPEFSSLLAGVAHDIGNCVCNPGFYLTETTDTCTSCQPGYFKSMYGDQACTSCGSNTTGPSGATNQTQCECSNNYEAGFQDGPDVGGFCVPTCGLGYEGTAGVCTPCPSGSYKDNIGTVCTLCSETENDRVASPTGAYAASLCSCPLGHLSLVADTHIIVQEIGAVSQTTLLPVTSSYFDEEEGSWSLTYTDQYAVSERLHKIVIEETFTQIEIMVNNRPIYECYQFNCPSNLDLNLDGMMGTLRVKIVNPTYNVQVFVATHLKVTLTNDNFAPSWYSTDTAERWASQRLLYQNFPIFAMEKIYDATDSYFDARACTSCPVGLICADSIKL